MTSSTKSRLSHVLLALTECNGGSLAASGLQMSLKQNRSAALSVEPEIDQVLAWFTVDSSIDRGAPAKLWDGSTWHRPVMEKTRAFTIPSCGEIFGWAFGWPFGLLIGPLDFWLDLWMALWTFDWTLGLLDGPLDFCCFFQASNKQIQGI